MALDDPVTALMCPFLVMSSSDARKGSDCGLMSMACGVALFKFSWSSHQHLSDA